MSTAPIQPNLFDAPREFPNRAPLAARQDPFSSHPAAARYTDSGARTSMKAKLLAWMCQDGRALTSAEIASYGNFDRTDVGRRMSDMEADGLVERLPARPCTVKAGDGITWRAL